MSRSIALVAAQAIRAYAETANAHAQVLAELAETRAKLAAAQEEARSLRVMLGLEEDPAVTAVGCWESAR